MTAADAAAGLLEADGGAELLRREPQLGGNHVPGNENLVIFRVYHHEISAPPSRAGSSRISRIGLAQYTLSRFARLTSLTMESASSRATARCAVVNAMSNSSAIPFTVRN